MNKNLSFTDALSQSVLGNFHKGCPIFGMDGWSGKKGQNRTRQVGWFIKKGRPIFQPIVGETDFSNHSCTQTFRTEL